ncbi:hypothetical protein [Archangium sp.]|uniref:SLOG cluster 4 domain-containing protein n=1 Tax=Archangium sp. TaxID=1872627 RepID=UPI003899CDAF
MSTRKPLVAVIGDAVVAPGSRKEQLAEQLGGLLVTAGYRVLTGGLGGVMEAACRGARGAESFQPGDTVGLLPGFDPDEANPYVDVVLPTGLDHMRNALVSTADAVVAIGGGAGTMAELAHAWLLKRLIVGFRVEGWSGRVADTRLDDRIRHRDVPDDRVYGVDSPQDALALLGDLLPRYTGRHRGIRRRS